MNITEGVRDTGAANIAAGAKRKKSDGGTCFDDFFGNAVKAAERDGKVDSTAQPRYQSYTDNVSDDVKRAWDKAAAATGLPHGPGLREDGMATHISSVYVVKVVHFYQTGNWDVMGSDRESAVDALKKALDLFDNPLGCNPRFGDSYKQEREFYVRMLEELEGQ